MVMESIDDTIEPVDVEEKSMGSSTNSGITDDPALSNSTGKSSAESVANSAEAAAKFVQRETRHVWYLRVLVLFLLVSASAAISLVVFFVTDAGEHETFRSQYDGDASKITGKYSINLTMYLAES